MYSLDPCPDALVLSSGCTSGTSLAWFFLDGRHIASLVGLRGVWRQARTKLCFVPMDPRWLFPETTIKAGHINCKIRTYIPNPLHCFKCQRFGHSQTSCRGQLTCSRCASAGHASTDCNLEPKCINCSHLHPADSKLCPKWKIENKYKKSKQTKYILFKSLKLVVPQLSQTYAQATKFITISNSSQRDENITKIKCPPLKLLQLLSSLPIPNVSTSTSAVSTSASLTQVQLLLSTSIIAATVSKPEPPTPISNDLDSNNMFTPIESSLMISTSSSILGIQPPSTSNTVRDSKQNSKTRIRKRKRIT
ncbi:uncharacterized protein TNCV_4544581 [Trichonephila clavipes]|nr:uncharacterized protein TNCV_4544581 [Trichonephila clavipes]